MVTGITLNFDIIRNEKFSPAQKFVSCSSYLLRLYLIFFSFFFFLKFSFLKWDNLSKFKDGLGTVLLAVRGATYTISKQVSCFWMNCFMQKKGNFLVSFDIIKPIYELKVSQASSLANNYGSSEIDITLDELNSIRKSVVY